MSRRFLILIGLAVLVTLAAVSLVGAQDDNIDPEHVTLVGNLQATLGCGGDWDPTCEATFLTYDTEQDLWMGTFDLPAGEYEYKIALNLDWEPVNYGLDGVDHGPNAGAFNRPMSSPLEDVHGNIITRPRETRRLDTKNTRFGLDSERGEPWEVTRLDRDE